MAHVWGIRLRLREQGRCVLVCGLVGLFVLGDAWIMAQGFSISFEKVQDRIVAVTCEATDRSDQESKRTTSTGFFVSPHGDIITSFHLLKNKKLKQYDPLDLDCWVSIGNKESRDEQAPRTLRVTPMSHNERYDLLHLRMNDGRSNHKYFVVSPNPQRDAPEGSTVYTSGFPNSIPSKVDSGQVTSTRGPEEHEELWAINREVEEGQSGSPVFLENLKVIGLIRGKDRGQVTQSYLVPSSYIVSLLPWLINLRQPDSPAGHLRVDAFVIETPKRQEKTFKWSPNNISEDPDKRVSMCIQPTPGWFIEKESVRFIKKNISGSSEFNEPIGSTEACGVLLTGTIRNTKGLGYAIRGGLEIEGTYTEVKQESKVTRHLRDEEVSPGPMTIVLPPGTESYKVELETFDGTVVRLLGKGQKGRLEVKDDAQLKSLSIEILE